jgi:peptidoglycan LD-endopeptidase LytH
VLGIILTTCGWVSQAGLPTLMPTMISLPSTATQPSATFTPMPPSLTFTFTPSNTATPSATFTSTFTEIPSATPTIYPHVFPLQPVNVSGFTEGTASHGYPATDIFAPEGTKFVAVTDGVVDFVSTEDKWDPNIGDMSVAGGLCVAIVGDDGVRYYGSHLSKVAPGISPGVRVTAGELLGYVGHTGNARTTQSHLHFGISRPTTPDDWKARRGQVDPFPFLQAWRDGHNVTPPLPEP